MTTSPFGTPVPQETPAPDVPTAGSSRRSLLLAVGGVGAAAALGAGAFLLLGGGDDEPVAAPVAEAPRGTDTVEPTPAEPERELVTVGSRNPFAAQVVAGGGGAAASDPVTGTAPAGTSVTPVAVTGGGSSGAGGSGGGVTVSIPGEPGPAGADGKDGKNGRNGVDGADGADGLTPTWTTLTLRDVVDDATATPKGTFTVRNAVEESTEAGVVVGDELTRVGAVAAEPVVVTGYEDIDGDGQLDYATVQVGDAGPVYSVWVGEALPLFGY